MWFINWIWGRLRRRKRKRSSLLFYLLVEIRLSLADYESLKDFFAFSNSKTCPRIIGLIT
jgi:hypothetical protein